MQAPSSMFGQLSGLAAMLSGVLWSAKAFYDRNDGPPWPTDITDTLFFVVPLLFLVGLIGLYVRCKGRLGEWEALSSPVFAAAFIGLATSIVGLVSVMYGIEPGWWMFVFGFFLMNLGLVFVGNSIVQTEALPRLKALPLAIGSLGILLILISDPPNSPLGVYPALALWMLYGLGWVGLGYVLLASRSASVRKIARAS